MGRNKLKASRDALGHNYTSENFLYIDAALVHSSATLDDGISQARPPAPDQPRMEVGMIDPRLNETVTYVAEMDVDAAEEDIRQMRRSYYRNFTL